MVEAAQNLPVAVEQPLQNLLVSEAEFRSLLSRYHQKTLKETLVIATSGQIGFRLRSWPEAVRGFVTFRETKRGYQVIQDGKLAHGFNDLYAMRDEFNKTMSSEFLEFFRTYCSSSK